MKLFVSLLRLAQSITDELSYERCRRRLASILIRLTVIVGGILDIGRIQLRPSFVAFIVAFIVASIVAAVAAVVVIPLI